VVLPSGEGSGIAGQVFLDGQQLRKVGLHILDAQLGAHADVLFLDAAPSASAAWPTQRPNIAGTSFETAEQSRRQFG
jgi:hypothetical protein